MRLYGSQLSHPPTSPLRLFGVFTFGAKIVNRIKFRVVEDNSIVVCAVNCLCYVLFLKSTSWRKWILDRDNSNYFLISLMPYPRTAALRLVA